MESKKGMSPILIVILTIIGTCLVGFLVYYGVKYFKGEEKSNTPTDNPPVVNPNNLNGNQVEDLAIFNLNSNAVELNMIPSVTDLYTNFENIKKEINGISLNYTCVKYSEYEFEYSDGNIETKNSCSTVKIVINDKASFYHEVNYTNIINNLVLDGATIKKVVSEKDKNVNKIFVGSNTIMYFNNYFIDFRSYCCGTDDNAFTIYDINGKEKLSVGDVKTDMGDGTMSIIGGNVKTVYNNTYDLKPIIVNSKLYYLEDQDEKCYFKSIDLVNNLKANTIKELDGRCG